MYSAVLPSYRSGKKKEEEETNGDDPTNIDEINAFGNE